MGVLGPLLKRPLDSENLPGRKSLRRSARNLPKTPPTSDFSEANHSPIAPLTSRQREPIQMITQVLEGIRIASRANSPAAEPLRVLDRSAVPRPANSASGVLCDSRILIARLAPEALKTLEHLNRRQFYVIPFGRAIPWLWACSWP